MRSDTVKLGILEDQMNQDLVQLVITFKRPLLVKEKKAEGVLSPELGFARSARSCKYEGTKEAVQWFCDQLYKRSWDHLRCDHRLETAELLFGTWEAFEEHMRGFIAAIDEISVLGGKSFHLRFEDVDDDFIEAYLNLLKEEVKKRGGTLIIH